VGWVTDIKFKKSRVPDPTGISNPKKPKLATLNS
jgi:hypothetical protein